MSSTGIEITNVGSVRIITFNNPKTKNALNKNTYAALTQALKEAGVDETVTLVALTGSGSYYSSGNDMIALSLELKDDIDTAREQNLNTMRDFVHALIRFPKLLVAVVNGPCFGIAATTIPLCDVVYASESAYFYTPFTALGICAEACSSFTFTRVLGPSKAAEMLLLNHKLSAQEALQFKFVSELYVAAELETKIWPRIKEIAKLPPGSTRISKRLMRRFDENSLMAACEFEVAELWERLASDEAQNAMVKLVSRTAKTKL